MLLDVESLAVEPNDCDLEEPIGIKMTFNAPEPIKNASWKISFVADHAQERKIVRVGSTKPVEYAAGRNRMEFLASKLDVAHLKRHVLANVGLLLAVLYSGDEELLQVSMVTQVSPKDDGRLVRSIFNPLE